MQCCPCSVKCRGLTWGISGDVCHIYISVVFSAGMLTTFEKVISLRTDYGDECDFATDYMYVIYIW
jgi:hypothetical protein